MLHFAIMQQLPAAAHETLKFYSLPPPPVPLDGRFAAIKPLMAYPDTRRMRATRVPAVKN
jgi:hypothetical protein